MQLTKGTHQCRVATPANSWFGEAGNNNTPFLRIPLLILTGECKGERVIFQGWLSDKSAEKTIKSMVKAFPGWDGDLEPLMGELSAGFFVGKNCEIVCEEEEYPEGSGKFNVKVKWLNPPGGGNVLDKSRAAVLVKHLNARSKAAATGEEEPAPPPAKLVRPADPLAPADDGDAIPF